MGHNAGQLRVEVDYRRFRVRTASGSTLWLPDTPNNRHRRSGWQCLRVHERGLPWFTLQA